MKLSTIAWRNISRNRNRSILSATAMLVVSMVLVLGFSVLEGMKAELIYNVHTFSYGELRIRNPNFEKNQILNPMHLNITNGAETLAWTRAQPETDLAVGRITFGSWIQRGEKRYQAQGWGVDFASEEPYAKLGSLIRPGGALPTPGQRETLIGSSLAEKLGLKVGDKFTFMTITKNRSMNGVTLKITGLVDFPLAALSGLVFMTSLESAQTYLQMDGAILSILVKTKSGTNLEATTERWNNELKPQGLEAATWKEASFVYTLTQFMEIIINFVGVMFVLLGSAVIINTTMMVVFERRKEIGTLGALGMHGGELIRLFLLESLFLASIGATLGVLLGTALSGWLGYSGINLSALTSGLNLEFPALLRPVLNLRSVVGSLLMTIVLSGVASLMPSWMAARIQPVEALRA